MLPRMGFHDPPDDDGKIDGFRPILDPAGAGEAQEGVDNGGKPRHRRLDIVNRLGHFPLDDGSGPLDGGFARAAGEQFLHVLAEQAQLPGKALQIDQRRAQVVRDAVNEHLVLLILLIEIAIGLGQLAILLFQRGLENRFLFVRLSQARSEAVKSAVEIVDFIVPPAWAARASRRGPAVAHSE